MEAASNYLSRVIIKTNQLVWLIFSYFFQCRTNTVVYVKMGHGPLNLIIEDLANFISQRPSAAGTTTLQSSMPGHLLHWTLLPKVQITKGSLLTSIKSFACTYHGHSLDSYIISSHPVKISRSCFEIWVTCCIHMNCASALHMKLGR
jgi:hypothetical protein